MRAVSGPLSGITVVAVEQSVAAPLATRILCELGADVIKVERAGSGDFSRHWDSHVAGEGAQFWWLNRGKRSIALNLAADDDRELLARLLHGADVLVHNMSPAAAERCGLDRASLQPAHPALVVCQISGYGACSPSSAHRKTYDMLIQAESGIMSLTGTPDSACRVGVSLCDVASGLYCALLVLAALLERARTGRGRAVDLAMLDVAMELVSPMLMSSLNAEAEFRRSADRHHAIAPYGVFRCRDGVPLLIAIEQDGEWRAFCRLVLGEEALGTDRRFATNIARMEHRTQLEAKVQGRFDDLDAETAIELLDRSGFAYGRLNDMAAVREHPVLRERGTIASARSFAGARVRSLAGVAERVFGTAERRRRRPPRLDEDRAEISRLAG